MTKPPPIHRCSTKSPAQLLGNRLLFFFFGAATAAVLLCLESLGASLTPFLPIPTDPDRSTSVLHPETPDPTFYDDPSLSYTLDKPITGWDEKRRQWLRLHPSFSKGGPERVLMVTGSAPGSCPNPGGDHLLLRFYKNKADYCRAHGLDLFYNTAHLHPAMPGCWAKLPLLRAAMVAHPEADWIWWVDEDAAFTDMEFLPPFDRYRPHHLVVPGWPYMVYHDHNWVGLNAGVFLLRNSQWSLDFLHAWAQMGPQAPGYDRWGETLRARISGKHTGDADDQSALVYLLVQEKERWGDKVFLENGYDLHGYWKSIIGGLDNVTEFYNGMERRRKELRRRHAEKVTGWYGERRGRYLEREVANWEERRRRTRPFVTHFTGCQPCSGGHNPEYTWEDCLTGMQRALALADQQVLRAYGYVLRPHES